MQMTIRGLNFDLTSAILEHVKRRLDESVGYYAPRVRAVTVRVSDVNGPRGGEDKRCSLEVSAEQVGALRVQEIDRDLCRAVDRAAARLRRLLAKEYGRRRTRRLNPRKSASGLPT